MDVYQIRRDNLHHLATQHGGVVALAHRIERDPSQISRYLAYPNGGTRLGEKNARHIEATLSLAPGWLSVHRHPNLPDHPLIHAACRYLSHSPDPTVADILATLINALTPPRP